mgnify:CR=1 FL=1
MFYLFNVKIFIGNVIEIVSALATIIASIVAVIGISTWKKQLIVKAEFDIAKRLMKSIYEIRSAIDLVRRPFQTSDEIEQAKATFMGKSNVTHDDNLEYKIQQAIYFKRWEKLNCSLNSFYSELLEAEALWGNDIIIRTTTLMTSVNQLRASIDFYLMEINYPETKDREKSPINRRIMISNQGSSIKDEFREQVQESIKLIEDFVKPKLIINKRKL